MHLWPLLSPGEVPGDSRIPQTLDGLLNLASVGLWPETRVCVRWEREAGTARGRGGLTAFMSSVATLSISGVS